MLFERNYVQCCPPALCVGIIKLYLNKFKNNIVNELILSMNVLKEHNSPWDLLSDGK